MVYLVTSHGKKPFPGGPAAFITVGLHWEDIVAVPDDVIAAIPVDQT